MSSNVIKKATNIWTKGLVMDFSPENTQNELLTHALNATLVTFNGNELSLQNDMGNARVETAFLPEGYMPVGTCEYGGIIYIVSYNPLENKSQIGCFPSPERNISSDELGKSDTDSIENSNFQSDDGKLKNTSRYVLLRDSNLNPGDKFLVSASDKIYEEKISDLFVKDGENFNPVHNPIIKLNIVSIEDSGKINYLNSDVRQYENGNYKYHILGKLQDNATSLSKDDIDTYRSTLSSGYNVFKSKTSGKLAILAELVTIDSYSVTHSLKPKKDEQGKILDGVFDIMIHTEVEPTINSETYDILPKLRYYYLKESQGQLQIASNDTYPGGIIYLFNKNENDNYWTVNPNFLSITLNNIYVPTTSNSLNLYKPLSDSGKFNFPLPGSYHCKMEDYQEGTSKGIIYNKFSESKFHRIKKIQITRYDQENESYDYTLYNDYYKGQLQAEFYQYTKNGDLIKVEDNHIFNDDYEYYIKSETDIYINAKRDSDKYNNLNTILYKIITEAEIAGEKEIADETIEKWIYQNIITYRLATDEDKNNKDNNLTFYTKDGDSYIQYNKNEFEFGVNYYIQEIKSTLVSVGTGDKTGQYSSSLYYYSTTKYYEEASQDDLNIYWDFDAYPKTETDPYGCPITLYIRNTQDKYTPATEEQKNNYKEYNLYYKSSFAKITDLSMYNDDTTGNTEDSTLLFIKFPIDTYISNEKFKVDKNYNDINSLSDEIYDQYEIDTNTGNIWYITQHIASDFILDKPEENSVAEYKDIKLATIKIPDEIHSNGLDLPFKYNYTIIPCMNYGKLEHLAVSNTVDFSKLHAFNQSNFNIWKYHIDGSDLRLTFGAEIYDTYEDNKVDALILEFYDLWGFAGSLEITGKKSYSGRFTKLIPMNQLNALSKKKISGNKYVTSFNRNIGILDKGGNVFMFNDREVEYDYDYDSVGWKYKDNKESFKSDNDCGTIYSNIVYGVKTYLRVTENNEYKFIPKKHFVLYTLPIYNDYYYSCNDFSNLENPKLDLVLTFKMLDSSKLSSYNEGKFSDGYSTSTSDKDLIDSYLGGNYSDSTLDVHKYIKYNGTSNLFLEIGLKEEYKNVNINYNVDINNYFSCNLQLVGSKDVLDIKYDETQFTSLNDALGYTNVESLLPQNPNKIGFGTYDTHSIILDNDSESDNLKFKNTNFLHHHGNVPIQIKYEFIVGYRAYIKDIHTSSVPVTTVCALCHKISDEEDGYNYSDFGIYKPNKDTYLSEQIFYNGGTADNTIFGICKQSKTTGYANTQLTLTCSDTSGSNNTISSTGSLNKGTPLQAIARHIGKLAFCMPHAHCIDDINGVSIQATAKKNINPDNEKEYDSCNANPEKWSYDDDYVITYNFAPSDKLKQDYATKCGRPSNPEGNSWGYDASNGISPGQIMYYRPKFNMVLNTKQSINNANIFVSTIEHEVQDSNGTWVECPASFQGFFDSKVATGRSLYTGIKGTDLAEFNKRMINTFKNVYAYNPDYDSLSVKVGTVIVQNNPIQFCSNVISTDAELNLPNDKTFNDYIFLGSILFSKYLTYLLKYSGNKQPLQIFTKNDSNEVVPIKQLRFQPNLRYCGGESNYLITSLTYNTQTPQSILDELEYKATNKTVVKHEDGTITYIDGVPDKRALYTFWENKKCLVQLDVSNYDIDSSGKLKLKKTYTDNLSNWVSNPNGLVNNNTITGGISDDFNNAIQMPDNIFSGSIMGYSSTDNSEESYSSTEESTSNITGYSSTYNTNQKTNRQIISTKLTSKYSGIDNYGVYYVTYPNSCLAGTTLTLNDLEYEPGEGHRLFVKDSCYKLTDYNALIFYRTLKQDSGRESNTWITNESWVYEKTKKYNWLGFFCGPCFKYKYEWEVKNEQQN